MKINLFEVISAVDITKQISTTYNRTQLSFNNEQYDIVKEDNNVNLEITNLGNEKIELKGNFFITVKIPCSRCAEEVSYIIQNDFVKVINFNLSEEDSLYDLDDMSFINGYDLDTDELIYQEIILVFPLQVLCKEDCKGICHECGTNLNYEQCKCKKLDIDPRMAVFQDILKDL